MVPSVQSHAPVTTYERDLCGKPILSGIYPYQGKKKKKGWIYSIERETRIEIIRGMGNYQRSRYVVAMLTMGKRRKEGISQVNTRCMCVGR